MKHVLIVNQSAELYGADKAILELIENYPEGYTPIVVLHQHGPLKDLLESKGIQVIFSSVIKIRRGIFTVPYLLQLPFEIIRSFNTIKKETKGLKIDLVHSNAISVFIGAFYASFFRINHLWHVHEIIEHPETAAKMYPKIVSFFADRIIFNSNSSRDQFLKYKPEIMKKSRVIHNGQERLAPYSDTETITAIRKNLFHCPEGAFVIGLVGRISRLKGQQLLLQAFLELSKRHNNIHLVYVGSPPDGHEYFLSNLEEKIKEFGLETRVSIVGFQHSIWPVYDSMDVVVVPSTEPESFGLVATEAMLSGKPVVGSNSGGLREIIADGETGFLFPSGDAMALADKLEILVSNKALAVQMGEKGKERVAREFSTAKFVASFYEEYESMT